MSGSVFAGPPTLSLPVAFDKFRFCEAIQTSADTVAWLLSPHIYTEVDKEAIEMSNSVGYRPSLFMHFENLIGWGSPLYHVKECIEAIGNRSEIPLEERFQTGLESAASHLFASTNRKPIPEMLENARQDGDHGDSYISSPLYRLLRGKAFDGNVELREIGHEIWWFLERLPRPYAKAVITNWLTLIINDIAAYAADSFQRADRAEQFRDGAFSLMKICLPSILNIIRLSGDETGYEFRVKTIRDAVDKTIFHCNQELGEMPPKLPTLLGGELFAPVIMVNCAHSLDDRKEKSAALTLIAEYWNHSYEKGAVSVGIRDQINALLEETLMADPSRLKPNST